MCKTGVCEPLCTGPGEWVKGTGCRMVSSGELVSITGIAGLGKDGDRLGKFIHSFVYCIDCGRKLLGVILLKRELLL